MGIAFPDYPSETDKKVRLMGHEWAAVTAQVDLLLPPFDDLGWEAEVDVVIDEGLPFALLGYEGFLNRWAVSFNGYSGYFVVEPADEFDDRQTTRGPPRAAGSVSRPLCLIAQSRSHRGSPDSPKLVITEEPVVDATPDDRGPLLIPGGSPALGLRPSHKFSHNFPPKRTYRSLPERRRSCKSPGQDVVGLPQRHPDSHLSCKTPGVRIPLPPAAQTVFPVWCLGSEDGSKAIIGP
ncbi:MAG: hypothetical protein M3063_06485 [Actinomycetota bacterium]|nr:hypothetical protein [Actinomycetota bacterium]